MCSLRNTQPTYTDTLSWFGIKKTLTARYWQYHWNYWNSQPVSKFFTLLVPCFHLSRVILFHKSHRNTHTYAFTFSHTFLTLDPTSWNTLNSHLVSSFSLVSPLMYFVLSLLTLLYRQLHLAIMKKHGMLHTYRCVHTCIFRSCPLLQELATLIPVGHKHCEISLNTSWHAWPAKNCD